MKKIVRFTLMSAVLGLVSSPAFAEIDCVRHALSVKHAIAANQSATLQIVEKEVAAYPGCACELVKAAIEGSKASVVLVAAIVETAATVAPEHLHLIAQCALAVAPDARANVQAVLAKLEPKKSRVANNKKDAKGATVIRTDSKGGLPPSPTVWSNPLDFPGSGIETVNQANTGGRPSVGPNPGGPGGLPFLPFGPPIFIPPVIVPPAITSPAPLPPPLTSPTPPTLPTSGTGGGI